jgi:hypothetical protein
MDHARSSSICFSPKDYMICSLQPLFMFGLGWDPRTKESAPATWPYLVIIDILHPRCKSILYHVVPSTTFFDAFLSCSSSLLLHQLRNQNRLLEEYKSCSKSVAKQGSNGLVGWVSKDYLDRRRDISHGVKILLDSDWMWINISSCSTSCCNFALFLDTK